MVDGTAASPAAGSPAGKRRSAPANALARRLADGKDELLEYLRRTKGSRAILLLWLLISALSAADLLQPLNQWLYGGYARLHPLAFGAAKVALIELPFSQAPAAHDWDVACRRLDSAGMLRLVVVAPLDDRSIAALAASPCAQRTVVGVELPGHGEREAAARTALARIRAAGMQAAILNTDARSRGSFSLTGTQSFADANWPTLEILAATGVPPATATPQTPDLRRPADTLPVFSIGRLLGDGAIPELVKERIVVLGYETGSQLRTFPIPGHNESISTLRYAGLAIDALARGARIEEPGKALRVAIYALIALLLGAVFQPTPLRSGILLLLNLAAAEALLTAALLGLFGAWLPIGEILLLQIAVFFAVYRAKALNDEQRLQNILISTTAQLQKRTRPENFTQTDEHWALVARLVDQTMQLSRTIFLERIPSDHRVKEIIALRCSLDDIEEMRRDYERTPYTTAIAEGGPIAVEKYLKPLAEEERQFLVPLTFGGEVLGFWAFGMTPAALAAGRDTSAAVNAIASQVAALLYQRKIWQERAASRGRQLEQLLEDRTQAAYRELGQSVLLMEQRLASLEQIFRNQANASILYNLFGHVLLVNPNMSTLLAAEGIAPYALNATDFIAALSRRPTDAIRPLLRRLVMDRQPFSLPLALAAKPDAHYLLKALPIEQPHGDDGEAGQLETTPFRLNGILVELVDISEMAVVAGIKNDLLGQVGHKLANELESLLLACYLLDRPDLAAGDHATVLELVQEAADRSQQIVDSARELISRNATTLDLGCYPVDPARSIARALTTVEPELAEHRLSCDYEPASYAALALIDPQDFEAALVAVLRFLAGDAVSGSAIRIATEVADRTIRVRLSNQGFGLPAERLRECLADDADNPAESFAALRSACRNYAQEGNRLEIASVIGSGITACFTLAAY